MTQQESSGVYGVMAEFDDPNVVVAAARRTYEAGYRRINAYSPYPIDELAEAIGFHHNRVALATLAGGLAGGLGGLALTVWTSSVAYPLNVGGRPYVSLPAFIPVIYECTILLASFGAVIGMFMMNRLPQPYHPVFNVPAFKRASQDGFFLCVKADDPQYNHAATKAFLHSLGAKGVSDVEN